MKIVQLKIKNKKYTRQKNTFAQTINVSVYFISHLQSLLFDLKKLKSFAWYVVIVMVLI